MRLIKCFQTNLQPPIVCRYMDEIVFYDSQAIFLPDRICRRSFEAITSFGGAKLRKNSSKTISNFWIPKWQIEWRKSSTMSHFDSNLNAQWFHWNPKWCRVAFSGSSLNACGKLAVINKLTSSFPFLSQLENDLQIIIRIVSKSLIQRTRKSKHQTRCWT